MGFAAIRGTAIDAVLYFGQEGYVDVYPEWFVEYASFFFVDADGESLFSYPGDYLYPERSYKLFKPRDVEEEDFDEDDPSWYISVVDTIVMRNKDFQIKHILYEEYITDFRSIGNWRAALKEDCVMFFVFSGDYMGDIAPYWIQDLVKKGLLIIGDPLDNSVLITDDGQIPVSEGSFIVKGLTGEIRYYEEREFYKYYEIGM